MKPVSLMTPADLGETNDKKNYIKIKRDSQNLVHFNDFKITSNPKLTNFTFIHSL